MLCTLDITEVCSLVVKKSSLFVRAGSHGVSPVSLPTPGLNVFEKSGAGAPEHHNHLGSPGTSQFSRIRS